MALAPIHLAGTGGFAMTTIPALFLERCARDPDSIAYYVPDDLAWSLPDHVSPDPETPSDIPGWRAYTLRQSQQVISGLMKTLHDLGVARGVALALVAETSVQWSAIDSATLGLGGVVVGIYPTLLGEQIAWQVDHSEARVLVVEDQAQYDKLTPHLEGLEHIEHVVSIHPVEGIPQLVPAAPDLAFMEQMASEVQPDDVATIVYTSGTTGEPKGAVLTHRCFTSIVAATKEALPMPRPADGYCRSVVFLPLAHVFQRFTAYRGFTEDIVGFYARSVHDLPEAMAAGRPHILAAVPRMLEKIVLKAEARARGRSATAWRVMQWAISVGRERHALDVAGKPLPLGLRVKNAVAHRLVFRKVKAGLGGHVELFVSGGAALNPAVASWFEAVGIKVREGWGLTETCAPAAVNRIDAHKAGTVGQALPGTEVRLADDGEILVKGPGLFRGYLKNEAATSESFTEDGYLKTGDLGEIDDDGFIRIVDRKKAIIVTAGGKNIAPVAIEKRLEGDIVGQAVVIGSERPFLVALIALEPENAEAWAREHGLPTDVASLASHPQVEALVQARVDAANQHLAKFESIKKFAILPRALSEEHDEITPTLKLKRRVIEERWADAIEALYAPGAGPTRARFVV